MAQLQKFWKDKDGSVWVSVVLAGGRKFAAKLMAMRPDGYLDGPAPDERLDPKGLKLPNGVAYADLKVR